jgi:hypothetical protein
MRTHFRALRAFMLLLMAAISCAAQTAPDQRSTLEQWLRLRTTDLIVSVFAGVDSEIETLRSDMRPDKAQLLTEAMNFTDSESKIFWPVYRRYEVDLASLNNQRVALNREYAMKYSTVSDKDAKAMLDKALNLESDRAQLKKAYAEEFQRKGLPAITTAKFFQVEDRLDALMDLKLAAELPSLLARKDASAQLK